MKYVSGLSAATFLLFCLPVAGSGVHSDVPPLGYSHTTFVDSRGCGFTRSTIGDWKVWVQRMDVDRKPVCDHEPTRFPQPVPTQEPPART